MNAIDQARLAYAPQNFAIRSNRAIEAQLIAQVTSRLRHTLGQNEVDFPAFVAALHDNRKMWTTLAVDVAGTDNVLPDALRARLFYLARFTDTHTQLVLKGRASAHILVDVNTAVLRGLNTAEDA